MFIYTSKTIQFWSSCWANIDSTMCIIIYTWYKSNQIRISLCFVYLNFQIY